MNIKLTRNNVVLGGVVVISMGFFFAGVFDVLDYLIVKILLLTGFAVLFTVAVLVVLDEKRKKNRPEEILQDDSNKR